MTLSVRFTGAPDGDDGPFLLSSATAWSAFARWAESLPAGKLAALRALLDKGAVKDTAALAAQLGAALKDRTLQGAARDAALALRGVLHVGDADETATVTDE